MNENTYRRFEKQLHGDAGLQARERWLDLARVGSRARVLECGEGTPVLFLTGGPDGGGSSWAYAAAKLVGVRALLLDRPGTGLSPRPHRHIDDTTLPSYVEDLTADVLDAFELESASVVGCSFGGYSALRSAAALPDRVSAVYLAGSPAFVQGWAPPAFFSLLRTPLVGRLIPRLPVTPASARMSLKVLGHRRSLAAGRLPRPLVEWVRAWQGDTATMRNDVAMIRSAGTWLGGFAKALELDDAALALVKQPCHVLVGTDDPVGREEVARRIAASVSGPSSVEVWEGAGHLPWYDDPARFAQSLQSFLTR